MYARFWRWLPRTEIMLSPWVQTQSLSMFYAWRGVGQTHVALAIAYAVASDDTFLERRCAQTEKGIVHRW
jgi:hypothetical protein